MWELTDKEIEELPASNNFKSSEVTLNRIAAAFDIEEEPFNPFLADSVVNYINKQRGIHIHQIVTRGPQRKWEQQTKREVSWTILNLKIGKSLFFHYDVIDMRAPCVAPASP